MKNRSVKIILINKESEVNDVFKTIEKNSNPSVELTIETEHFGKRIAESDFDLYFINIDQFSLQIIETIHQVKAKPRIVALTNLADRSIEGKARSLGITFLFVLPVNREDITSVING